MWGPGYEDDHDLRVFISQLRRKLGEDPRRPGIIATEPGIGYRWVLRPADDREAGEPVRGAGTGG